MSKKITDIMFFLAIVFLLVSILCYYNINIPVQEELTKKTKEFDYMQGINDKPKVSPLHSLWLIFAVLFLCNILFVLELPDIFNSIKKVAIKIYIRLNEIPKKLRIVTYICLVFICIVIINMILNQIKIDI